MPLIRRLRQSIDRLMEENRRKRLDAAENAKLEELFKQQHKETERINAERKRREQETEAPTKPAPVPAKPASDFVTLDVIGGGNVTCKRSDFEKIRRYAPFFWHISADGAMHPATLYTEKGDKVVMPLQNIVESLRSSGAALSTSAAEPFTNPREYRKIQVQRKCRNEQRRNSKT